MQTRTPFGLLLWGVWQLGPKSTKTSGEPKIKKTRNKTAHPNPFEHTPLGFFATWVEIHKNLGKTKTSRKPQTSLQTPSPLGPTCCSYLLKIALHGGSFCTDRISEMQGPMAIFTVFLRALGLDVSLRNCPYWNGSLCCTVGGHHLQVQHGAGPRHHAGRIGVIGELWEAG